MPAGAAREGAGGTLGPGSDGEDFAHRVEGLQNALFRDPGLVPVVLTACTGHPLVPPRVLRLRLLLRCDARCRMCVLHSPVREVELVTGAERDTEMDPGLAIRLAEEARALGASYLNLQGGEPFLYRGLEEVLGAGLRMGFTVQFFTNGGPSADLGLLERALALAGGSGEVLLRVSLDGTPEVHDAIRGVPGLFDEAARFVRSAAAVAGRWPGLRVGISYTVMRENVHCMLDVAEMALRWGVTVRFIPLVAYGPRANPDGTLIPVRYLPPETFPTSAQLAELAASAALLEHHPAVDSAAFLRLMPELYNGTFSRRVCLANAVGIYVTANGRYQACPISEETFAGVEEMGPREAWFRGMRDVRRRSFAGCRVPCTCYKPDLSF